MRKQMSLSIKQSLFSHRVSQWHLASELLDRFEDCEHDRLLDEGGVVLSDTLLCYLTNDLGTADMTSMADYETDRLRDDDLGLKQHNSAANHSIDAKLVKRLRRRMETLAQETCFLFEGECGEQLSKFITAYAALLEWLYRDCIGGQQLREQIESGMYRGHEGNQQTTEQSYQNFQQERLIPAMRELKDCYRNFDTVGGSEAIMNQINCFTT